MVSAPPPIACVMTAAFPEPAHFHGTLDPFVPTTLPRNVVNTCLTFWVVVTVSAPVMSVHVFARLYSTLAFLVRILCSVPVGVTKVYTPVTGLVLESSLPSRKLPRRFSNPPPG